MIRSIPRLGGKVLDLGCGYGVLGISIALLNPDAEVWFTDINERAVSLCHANCKKLLFSRGAAEAREASRGQGANNSGAAEARGASSRDAAGIQSRIICADGLSAFVDGFFNTIVTNPPIRTGKANLYRLLGDARSRLADGGALYLVIQKKQGMESTRNELIRLFGNCDDIARKAGYHILLSIK